MEHLRQPCSPEEYTGASNTHKHKCLCGTTWKHKGSDCRVSHEAFVLGHTCPNCGELVEMKHFTRQEEEEREEIIAALDLFAMLLGVKR